MTPAFINASVSLISLAVACAMAVSVMLHKPWTAPFAALVYREVSGTPLFQTINMAMSALWAILMAWLAFAWFAQLPIAARFLPLAQRQQANHDEQQQEENESRKDHGPTAGGRWNAALAPSSPERIISMPMAPMNKALVRIKMVK